MRRGHRWAHPALVLVCGALAAWFFGYGWTVRAERPTPRPTAAPEAPPGAVWEATIQTAAGEARVRYFEAGAPGAGTPSAGTPGAGTLAAGTPDAGPLAAGTPDAGEAVPFLWTTLPAELDAAEPGLILESAEAPPRALGSVAPGRPVVPVPGGLGGGEALVLVDLARDLELGRAKLPENAR